MALVPAWSDLSFSYWARNVGLNGKTVWRSTTVGMPVATRLARSASTARWKPIQSQLVRTERSMLRPSPGLDTATTAPTRASRAAMAMATGPP
jgi:hypothetical protein